MWKDDVSEQITSNNLFHSQGFIEIQDSSFSIQRVFVRFNIVFMDFHQLKDTASTY